jgi:peptidoglycan/LPS O-acetylase OafA/YrhL
MQKTMQSSSSEHFYVPALNGLRFLAVSLVIFVHWNFSSYRGNIFFQLSEVGWFGVDLFFVLSGYLITEILLREKEKFGSILLKNFWLRRILRIWPAYYAALILQFIVIPHFPEWKLMAPFPSEGARNYYTG